MCEPGQADPPLVTVWPADGIFAWTDSLVAVTINWFSGEALATNTREILLNGVNVTGQFTYSGGTQWAESYGTVRLVAGLNQFSARICDTGGQCTTVPRQYTYTPPPAPLMTLSRLHRVKVTPEETTGMLPPGGSGTITFTATNVGDTTGVYLSDAVCNGAFTACSRWPTSLQLAPGQSGQFHVNMTAGAAGGLISARLTARHQVHTAVQAEGSAEVAVTVASGPTIPVVSVAEVNSGTMIDRSGCVTVGLGGDAAYECGDLRIVHTLPATRTLNRARAPVLVYNHQHARPFPIIQADVRLPAGASVPTMVEAVAIVPGVTTYTRTWSGSEWSPGETRRIGMPIEGLGLNTGFHTYTLEVTFWYGSTPYRAAPISGEYAVVSRRHSPFGSGWWLAGLEWIQRQPPDWSTLIWVGGDGSTRRFSPRPGHANEWLSEVFDGPPDTLSLQQSPVEFRRSVRGGGSVHYDAAGNHIRTVDRLGRTTTFNWVLVNNAWRLSEVVLPVASGTAPKYVFSYDATGRLSAVSAPPLLLGPTGPVEARITQFTPSGSSRDVVQITDPDFRSVAFGYHPGVAHRIASRTDRRGTTMQFGFGSLGRFTDSHLDLQDGTVISHQFDPQESRGVFTSASVFDTHTFIDGPRAVSDHTRIWVNRWGAPMRIQDALGNETRLFREHPTYPALVTRIVAPNGYTQRAQYDHLARLTHVIGVNSLGDGRNDTTRYEYDNGGWPRFPTRIVSAERDSVVVTYDALGRRETIQPGPDPARRVMFTYYPSNHSTAPGLVHTVQSPLVDAEVYGYDARGNLSSVGTPSRVKVSYLNDGIGRPVRTRTYLNTALTQFQRDTAIYSIMDRVLETRSWGPAMNGAPAQTLWVRNQYDDEGNLRFVRRWSDPDPTQIDTVMTEWRYDRANRALVEVAPDGQRDSTVYDAAGNAEAVHTRRGHVIEMEYDLLNRLTKRRVPQVTYGPRSDGIPTARYDLLATDNPSYPMYKSPNGGLVIAADSSMFGYDITGGILSADNADARVARTYYPNGLVRTETQRIRPVDGADWNKHVYQLAYAYDRNGRRAGVRHPAQLGPVASGNDWTAYGYHPETGALSTVVDPLHNAFGYEYRADGSLWKLTRPGGIVETFTYDNEGRLQTNVVQNGSNSPYRYHGAQFRNTTFTYDLRGKLLSSRNAASFADTLTSLYSGLGHVVSGGTKSRGFSQGVAVDYSSGETFALDALGNYRQFDTWSHAVAGTTSQYVPRTRTSSYVRHVGRLARAASTSQVDTFFYDAAGNQEFSRQRTGSPLEDRASYYAADGTLRAADYRTAVYAEFGEYRSAFEEYRYDALGRRVMVRSRRNCVYVQDWPGLCRLSTVRRTVWDGDHEFYEIQMPGQDGSPHLDNDTGWVSNLPMVDQGTTWQVDPSPFFGRVAYTRGTGIDQPLGILRMGYVDQQSSSGSVVGHRQVPPFLIVPLWDTRGQPTRGVFADGGEKRCETRHGHLRCIFVTWPNSWFVLTRPNVRRSVWHGTLIEDKADAAGTIYRRNRYYDPATGRFTQEDPIGLAGGLNLYGFAGGDPVNFHDPFGLCKRDRRGNEDPVCRRIIQLLRSAAADAAQGSGSHFAAAADIYESTNRAVRMVPARHWRQNRDNNPNTFALGETVRLRGPVLLNEEMGDGDLVATATHEALIHMENDDANALGMHFGDLNPQTAVVDREILNQLPDRLLGSAEFWKRKVGAN